MPIAIARSSRTSSFLILILVPFILMLGIKQIANFRSASTTAAAISRNIIGQAITKRAMHITSVPMWVGSSNNYAYIVADDKTKDAVVIDPANPPEIAPVLKEKVDSGEINLTAIVNTHHHWDHAGGNKEILKQFPKTPVIGGKDCDAVTKTPPENEKFKIGSSISVTPIYTPCHTQDSICYFVEDESTGDKAVFTGDTLFIGGCGKFFEGNPAEMSSALSKLSALPSSTKVYPGHEYTKSNVKFLKSLTSKMTDPKVTSAIQTLESFALAEKVTTGKTTIEQEREWNLFMRSDTAEMESVTGEKGKVPVLAKLREMKNSF